MIKRRFLGIEELAEYLGVRKSTLYAWRHQGKIPYIKIGRLVKFDSLEIDTWIEKYRIKERRDMY